MSNSHDPNSPVAWWLYGSTLVFLASEFTPDSEHRDEWVPLFAAQSQPPAVLAALREVIRISDRSHPAWDEVKAWLAHGIGEPK